MISLSRINGQKFFLNPELIESIESTPDTVITLSSGKTIMVMEAISLVVKRVMKYRKYIHSPKRRLHKINKATER